MEINSRDDLNRAYANGYSCIGRIGLTGKLRAYKTQSDFDLMLGSAQSTLEEGLHMHHMVLDIDSAMFKIR